MSGISDINILLKSISPKLQDGEYIFAVVSEKQAKNLNPILLK